MKHAGFNSIHSLMGHPKKVEVREIIPSDLLDTIPPDGPDQMCGLSALVNGELSAYGGIRLVGTKHFAFFNTVNKVSAPIQFHRLVKAGLDAAVQGGLFPIYSACQEADFKSARRWHKMLGFREVALEEKDDELRKIESFLGMSIWMYII
jgi:hypothetical protein